MFKLILSIFLTSLIYANSATSSKLVPLFKPFSITNKSISFDTDISYTHKRLLKCKPPLEAVYKIIDSHTIKIIPKKWLKRDTKYECTYKGKKLSFQTEPLKVLSYHYFRDSNLIRIEFNDTLDPKLAKEYIHIRKKDKLALTELKYTIKQEDNILLLKIQELISKDDILELSIDKALLSNGLNITLDDKSLLNQKVQLNDKALPLEIWDKPKVVALDNGEFAIRLFFHDYIDSQNIEKYIQIDGIDSFGVDECYDILSSNRNDNNISYNSFYYCDILSPQFKPNSTYTLILKKGLSSYNQELKEDKKFVVKTGNRAKSIILDNENKPYVSNKGEFGFSSINLDSVTLIVEKLLDDNLRYFVNFKNSNLRYVDKFSKEIFSKELKLTNIPNKLVKQKFSLSELNRRTLPFGVYKLTFRYQNGKKEKAKSKILFLSNIGISANISKTQAFIHIMRLDNAKPLVSTMVYLYGKNNDLIGSAKSDKYGVVILNDENLLSKKPAGIIVETKKDRNFLSLNNAIKSPQLYQLEYSPQRFRAYIYPQTQIIRPASKINALIIIKDNSFISAKNIPVKITLYNNYSFIKEKIYHTDEYGLIDFRYLLDKEDKTGDYYIEVSINNKTIGSKAIKVKAFVPPKIENHIYLSKEKYFAGELIDANITSNYFFGSPASYLKGFIKLDSEITEFRDKRYNDYSFTNYELLRDLKDRDYLYYRDEIQLDSNGRVNIILPLEKRYYKVPSILEGVLNVTIMDDNQPVGAYKKFKVYPYKNMVGIKLDKISLQKEEPLRGKVVLINPMDGKPAQRELYGVIKKVDWQYSYDMQNSHWNREVRVIHKFKLDSNSDFSIPINQYGNFIIEIEDRLGGHSATVGFDVWSNNYTNISPKDNIDKIDIDFKDKTYKEGDTLIATFRSPILEGNMLVSIEDDKIETYKIFNIEKGVAKVELPIDFENKGAYLHAVVYSATDKSSKLVPFRAIGYKYIKPDNSAHKIQVNLYAPKKTKSRNVVNLNIDINKKSKVLISVVDKAILELIQQKKPKIFEFFNQQKDKKISYYDFYDLVMSYLAEGKMISFGAGEKLNLKTKHLAPTLAKRIKPFMLWSGLISPQNSSFKFPIGIPQFNGKVSIVAIAVNSDSVGVASCDMVVKDDLAIKPSFPLYVIRGDNIQVPIRLFNNTSKQKDINLSYSVSKNLLFKFDENSSITIPPNSSKVVTANLSATQVGKGEINIFAKDKKEIITHTTEIPIYTPYSISTKTFRGITDKKENFIIPPEYKNAKVYINLSDNVLGVLRDDLKYLIDYPYGCLEQTASKILAMYYAQPFLKNDTLVRNSKKFIIQGIKKIKNMQEADRDFNYWENGSIINPYASLYASETILDLYRGGVKIDKYFINSIIETLKAISLKNKNNYYGKYSDFHRIYSAYILAENGKLPSSILNMLYKKGFYKKHFLSSLYMSAILKIKGKTKEADELYASIPYTLSSYQKKSYRNSNGDFESNIRDMFLHFIIKTKYFNKNSKDLSIVEKSFDDIKTTQEKAIALKAISIFLGKPENRDINVTLKVNNSTKTYTKPSLVAIDKIKSDTITIIPNKGVVNYNIQLIKPLPKIPKNRLSKSKKLSIKREFVDKNNKVVNLKNLKWGDTIFSKVTIANYGEIDNVVINHRIPTCFSLIDSDNISNKKFKNRNIKLNYKDIRDDRALYFVNLPKKKVYDIYTKKYIQTQNKGVIFTPLLVTTRGVCKNIAVITEAMYNTQLNDYAKETKEIIVK